MTIVKNVRKLDAAHYLLIDVEKGTQKDICYWDMMDAPALAGDSVELLNEKLEEIGKLIIRADVPVGVALSGGLDSSLIAALAAQHYGHELHAFTAGYPGQPACDERAQAKELADGLGIQFHGVEIPVEDVVGCFPLVNALRDDPIADISGHGYYHVAKAAREAGVPVLLQGQGGDELFWGYEWVRKIASDAFRKQKVVNGDSLALLRYLNLEAPKGLRPWQLRLWLESRCGLRDGVGKYRDHKRRDPRCIPVLQNNPSMQWVAENRTSIFGEAITGYAGHRNGLDSLFLRDQPWPNVGCMVTKFICDTYLRENGITQGDRFSMASSVEMRLPLLDHKLVETVVGLRKKVHDFRNPPKAWLKDVAHKYLPAEVIKRRKRGFEPPVHLWYKRLLETYGEIFLDGYLVNHGYIQRNTVVAMLENHYGSGIVFPLWFRTLVLECWISSSIGNL